MSRDVDPEFIAYLDAYMRSPAWTAWMDQFMAELLDAARRKIAEKEQQ